MWQTQSGEKITANSLLQKIKSYKKKKRMIKTYYVKGRGYLVFTEVCWQI